VEPSAALQPRRHGGSRVAVLRLRRRGDWLVWWREKVGGAAAVSWVNFSRLVMMIRFLMFQGGHAPWVLYTLSTQRTTS
jgi:hypothetical protein